MKDKKFEKLIKEALKTSSRLTIAGEITTGEIFDAQSHICGSYTTMTTDMNKFNRVLDDLITMRDKEVEEAIKTAMSISRRSIVHMVPPNYFDPTIKVFFYDPYDTKFDKEYFKEKGVLKYE